MHEMRGPSIHPPFINKQIFFTSYKRLTNRSESGRVDLSMWKAKESLHASFSPFDRGRHVRLASMPRMTRPGDGRWIVRNTEEESVIAFRCSTVPLGSRRRDTRTTRAARTTRFLTRAAAPDWTSRSGPRASGSVPIIQHAHSSILVHY
jgi:hypothetical protein